MLTACAHHFVSYSYVSGYSYVRSYTQQENPNTDICTYGNGYYKYILDAEILF